MNKPVMHLVTSTAGRFDMLEKLLNSIYRTVHFPVSITVIDDGTNKDEKLHYLHLFRHNPDLDTNKVVVNFTTKRHESRSGFPVSMNDGAKTSAPLLVFLNDDVELQEGCLEKIRQVMDNHKDIGVCGAKLLFPPTSVSSIRPAGKVQHVGIALDIRARALHPLVGWSADNPKTCVSREVLATTGALFAIRTNLFKSFGGFDTIYGQGYWEDVDLCLKVRQKGYRIWMESQAIAYHYVGASGEKLKVQNSFQQNEMIFKARWANSGLLVWDEWLY